MKVYVLCMSERDRDGDYWYEPTEVFSTREAAEIRGKEIGANYLLPSDAKFIVHEFEVKE